MRLLIALILCLCASGPGDRRLHRYLAEFDFRYSNRAKRGVTDKERADKTLKGIEGKRLTYRRIEGQKAASLG